MQKTAYLILENGMVFKGQHFGYDAEAVGELVFTTAMTGYLETLTDPSYYGQIVMQTFPLIGNYGVIPEDFESERPAMRAYVVRQWCEHPSNFREQGRLDKFLIDNKIVGICGVDTRTLTKIVREHGVMNAAIVYSETLTDKQLAELKSYTVRDAVLSVSSSEENITKSETGKHKVVLWDFGAKENIRRSLLKRGLDVICVPANTTAARIRELNPDGIMLSNGPGDPAENTDIIKTLKDVCKLNIPTFGICLGHQLLALSQGAKTSKLKYGHRGANQPAVNVETGRVYITSQNHGYAVINDSLPETAKVSFINGNDGTCEGVKYLNMPAFSVQFHPEACGGPLDTNFLFDEFISLIEGGAR